MKKLQVVFITLFFVLLALPLVFFNWEENVVSEIDNRQLTNNPFGPNAEPGADLTASLESYVLFYLFEMVRFSTKFTVEMILMNSCIKKFLIH